MLKKSTIKSFTFLLFLAFSTALQAQWSFGITIGGIALHQGHMENNDVYKLKIDKKGRAVIFGGVSLSLSYQMNEKFGIKAVQGLVFYDSAGKFAGISHLGLELHDDLVGMRQEKHQFSTSVGPFIYYRHGWTKDSNYKNDPSFIPLSKNNKWEYKFTWLGGFFSYRYQLEDDNQFKLQLLPGYPHVYALTGGLSRKI